MRCPICLSVFLLGPHCIGHYGKVQNIYSLAKKLYLKGKSARQIGRTFGIGQKTAIVLCREFRNLGLISNCPCGKVGGHKGWCSFRFTKSDKRKAFVDQWHERTGKNDV